MWDNGPIGNSLTTQAYAQEARAGLIRTPTLKDRLELAVKEAETRLAAVKEAREIFERNPDIERLLDIMQKGTF